MELPPLPDRYAAPPPSGGTPTWLVVLLVASGLIGAGAVGLRYLSRTQSGTPASAPSSENAGGNVSQPAAASKSHPYAKYLELTGFRILESANRSLDIRMAVVNHSAGELQEMKLDVELRAANSAPGSPPISKFSVKVPPVPAFSARDVRASAATTLRAYEFPDWQFLRAEFTIVSP